MKLDKLRYDLHEASMLLCFSPQTIMKRIEQGKILDAYKDGKKWYIPRESIISYHENLKKY